MVRSFEQQQCYRENVALRISISDDRDDGPANLNHHLLWTILQLMGRPKIRCRHTLALLFPINSASGAWKIPRFCFQSRQYLESPSLLCAHWYETELLLLHILLLFNTFFNRFTIQSSSEELKPENSLSDNIRAS